MWKQWCDAKYQVKLWRSFKIDVNTPQIKCQVQAIDTIRIDVNEEVTN